MPNSALWRVCCAWPIRWRRSCGICARAIRRSARCRHRVSEPLLTTAQCRRADAGSQGHAGPLMKPRGYCCSAPLDRVAGLRGRRFAGGVDLFPDGLHAGEIECRRWSGSGAILHANSKLTRIGHEAEEPRGVSAQDRAMSPGRCRPSFLHLLLAVDAVRDPDVITAERLPRCGGAERYLGALE